MAQDNGHNDNMIEKIEPSAPAVAENNGKPPGRVGPHDVLMTEDTPPSLPAAALIEAADHGANSKYSNILRGNPGDYDSIVRKLIIHARNNFARTGAIDLNELLASKAFMEAAEGGRARREYAETVVGSFRAMASRFGNFASGMVGAYNNDPNDRNRR